MRRDAGRADDHRRRRALRTASCVYAERSCTGSTRGRASSTSTCHASSRRARPSPGCTSWVISNPCARASSASRGARPTTWSVPPGATAPSETANRLVAVRVLHGRVQHRHQVVSARIDGRGNDVSAQNITVTCSSRAAAAARSSATSGTSTPVVCQPARASQIASGPSPQPPSSARPGAKSGSSAARTPFALPLHSPSSLRAYRSSQSCLFTSRAVVVQGAGPRAAQPFRSAPASTSS